MATSIKQIKVGDTPHEIDAKYWNGKEFEDVESMIHGVVDTYVIPTSKQDVSGYSNIVGKTNNTITAKKSELNDLVSVQPADINKSYKVGDIILIEEASTDSKFVFDRWVSAVGTETDPVISLTILETQVATHHHTLGVSTSKSLTGVSKEEQTATIPIVGTPISVVTSATGTFVTSVTLTGGDEDLGLSHTSGTGSVSHKHSVESHSHNITPNTLVSQTIGAYTTLTSKNHTPHTHETETVAGAHVNASTPITIVTGANGTDTFVKSLTQTPTNTTSVSLTTSANTTGLSTNTQASTDTITSDIQTLSSGAHTHDVTTTTTEDVVKTVTVAPSVVTSVSYTFTRPSIPAYVMTSVTKVKKTAVTSVTLTGTTTFINSWTANVDDSGVLSFAPTSSTVTVSAPTTTISGVNTMSRVAQTSGSLTIDTQRSEQSHTSGVVSASGSAASNGGHTHGFGHTHSISSHTHGIANHQHNYDKATVSSSSAAITSLSTISHTPHTHTDVTVAATASNGESFKYITGGDTTDVVRNLKTSEVSTTSSTPETSEVYTKLTGEITFPGLSAPTGSIDVSRESITPAATGTETAIKSITFTSSNFVTGLTSGDSKTSENKGGK